MKNCERFGDGVILEDYVNELAGTTVKSSDILRAIKVSLNNKTCPTPKEFRLLIGADGVSQFNKSAPKNKWTSADQEKTKDFIGTLENKSLSAREMHKKLGLDFSGKSGKARYMAQIKTVAQHLMEKMKADE